MKPTGSLPCSQERSTGPSSEPDHCSLYHPVISKIHLNIILPFTSWPSWWYLSFCFSTKILYAFLFSPCLLHNMLIPVCNYTRQRVQLWCSYLCSFLRLITSMPFGPNILLKTLFSYSHGLCFSLSVRESFTPIQNHRQNCSFVYSDFYISRPDERTKGSGLNGSKQYENSVS
jgi:hypothetical protein